MSRVATIVPAEGDLLCEGCGYTLNGLPIASNCPECGRAIESSVGNKRTPPEWETGNPTHGAFLRTSLEVIFRPTRFYQTTAVRGNLARARSFAWIHWGASAAVLTTAVWVHTHVITEKGATSAFLELLLKPYGALALGVGVFAALIATTHIAARLTAWEAVYRGLRLPIDVVRRGLFYHAAHYLPVAMLTLLTVAAYRVAVNLRPDTLKTAEVYLYVICGEVILFAGYLFHTYWIAMRNMMYANR